MVAPQSTPIITTPIAPATTQHSPAGPVSTTTHASVPAVDTIHPFAPDLNLMSDDEFNDLMNSHSISGETGDDTMET
jgi:hypothetical protein